MNGTFAGPVRNDGVTPDYRFRENRIYGLNKNGEKDKRCKDNR